LLEKEREFELRRSIQSRNSFLPIAFGKISACKSGAKIEITLQPHIATIIVTLFIVSFVALLFVGLVSTGDFKDCFVLLGMFSFATYFLIYFGFWLEIPKLKLLISNANENG